MPSKAHVNYPLLVEKDKRKTKNKKLPPLEKKQEELQADNPSATLLKSSTTGRKAGTLPPKIYHEYQIAWLPRKKGQKHSNSTTPEAQAHRT